MKDLFDGELPEGRKPSPPPSAVELRDEALARVAANAGIWYGKALMVLATLPFGWTGTGEDMRHFVEGKIGPPHDRHAQGALVRHAIKARLFTPTGERRKMKDPQSHARKTDVYRRG